MLALMPRVSECVLCGETIPGRGRIDRIYCSASCRTLAWRARAGDRFDGRRKPRVPAQPGDFVARKALPLLAVRMKAELDAAKRRIAELEQALGEQTNDAVDDGLEVAGVAAVVGIAALFAALRKRLNRRQRVELDRIRAAIDVEREQQQTELTTEREKVARREADHGQQMEALSLRVKEAEQREQVAKDDLTRAHQLCAEIDARHVETANHCWRTIWEAARLRTEHANALTANVQLQAILTNERRQAQKYQGELLDLIQERDVTLNEMEQAHTDLAGRAKGEQQRLTDDNQRLQKRLARLETRARRNQAALRAGHESERQRLNEPPVELVAIEARASTQKSLTTPERTRTERQLAKPQTNRPRLASPDKPRDGTAETKKRKKQQPKEEAAIGIGNRLLAAAGGVVTVATALLLGGSGSGESKKLGASSKKQPKLLTD